MKTVYLFFFIMILFAHQALSNNVQVSNVRLTGQNTTSDFTLVEFDITWENSWRYNNGPANWDAAWVFVKFKVGSGGAWQHAWLNNTGHTVCSNVAITNGLLSPELAYHSSTNPVLGVFLYRSAAGTGTISCQDVRLRWNYGSHNVADAAQVDIEVFAIEMVYIPDGAYYVGSGGTEIGGIYEYPSTTVPYHITSEAAITVGTAPGNLYYNTSGYSPGDQQGPVPAAFPKGFKAFYAMKYEITQQGYTDFLNTLSRTQQMSRVGTDISGTTVVNRFVMTASPSAMFRSYIKCRASIPPQPGSVEFYCDYNNNNVWGEDGDGQHVACNMLNNEDTGAYLDWAALRFMTELEFEKCGRGNQPAQANEYAWGNSSANPHVSVNNFSTSAETPNDLITNFVSNASDGPLRVGAFARIQSSRTTAGAGFYGAMEITSNLTERGVNFGTAFGRAYTGNHGDGLLSVTGDYNVTAWPTSTNAFFLRGGSWDDSLDDARLSDRKSAASGNPGRIRDFGGRGVRTK